MRKSLLIAIPTNNEAGNVRPFVELLIQQNLDADILFVDDNSPVGTGQNLDAIADQYENIKVIHRKEKQGTGCAHKVIISYAYSIEYHYLVTMDGDFTHNPADVPRLWAERGNFDIVVGSRYKYKSSISNWKVYRKLFTIRGHLLTRFIVGIPYDASGALRIYNLKVIPEAVFTLVKSTGYGFFFESLFILYYNYFRIGEIASILPARTYDSSKMKLQDEFSSAFRCLQVGYQK